VAYIFKTTRTKFYQNRPGFVDDVTKICWCVFSFHSSDCCLFTKREH